MKLIKKKGLAIDREKESKQRWLLERDRKRERERGVVR